MSIKIHILKYDDPDMAIRSIMRFDSIFKIPDMKKLTDAQIVRHVANIALKKSKTLEGRAKYKKVVSVYTSYIIKLERRIRNTKDF
jgi:uncharacterized protein YaaR (DUF327 family)